MIRRTIAAALLAGLASPVLAGQFASRAYDQAAGLAGGKTQADAAYDGGAARGAAAAPVAGSIRTAPAQTNLSAAHPSLETLPVPAPAHDMADNIPRISNVLYRTPAAPAGSRLPLGAAAGALAGAAAGIGIGFAMSKFLS